ncbi:hypothetical protein JCM1841_002339 [Sporobolomyces salmonicolor]
MPPPYATTPTHTSSLVGLPFSVPSVTPRRRLPTPIHPPPYCAAPPGSPSLPSPLSPSLSSPGLPELELEQDPHYLATATQRSYFVQLSDLFETEAVANHHHYGDGGDEEKRTHEDEAGTMKRAGWRSRVLGGGGGAKGRRRERQEHLEPEPVPVGAGYCCCCLIA